MEIVNTTPYLANSVITIDNQGQEHILSVIKATFTLPQYAGEQPQLVQDNPVPIIDADIFSDEAGLSAITFESDYAPKKIRCDVLLNGYAYAPKGEVASEVIVGVKVGEVDKFIRITGDRVWKYSPLGAYISSPTPFIKQEVSYDKAYGGVDTFHPEEMKHTTYKLNPAGIGYHKIINYDAVHEQAAPSTEELHTAIKKPNGKYQPMAFGSLGRSHPARVKYAGTYDQQWQDEQFPFLAKDFDERYFQSAPEDQQTETLKGGETVQLFNLSAQGSIRFKLPILKQKKVVYYFFDGDYKIADFKVDTLHLLPEEKIFTLTARASTPLYGDPFSCSKIIIGRGTKGWENALKKLKRYIPSIQELQAYKRKEKA